MSLPRCLGNSILKCRGYPIKYRRNPGKPCQEYIPDYHYCSLGVHGGYEKKVFDRAGGWFIELNIPQIIKLCQ